MPLKSREQTTDEMRRLVNMYYTDLYGFGFDSIPLAALNPDQMFDIVRRIPYRRDMYGTEVIGRPKYIIKNLDLGIDCKKKTLLLSSYAKVRKIPYRLACISKKANRRIHHIFPQFFINGEWRNFDATYSHYKPGQQKIVTRVVYA